MEAIRWLAREFSLRQRRSRRFVVLTYLVVRSASQIACGFGRGKGRLAAVGIGRVK
ncbi:MAG: hypothetical protein H0W49_14685 [Nitrospirales bacterium]|nr:hypothetical protein [Nitrospirales bacterium]